VDRSREAEVDPHAYKPAGTTLRKKTDS